MKINKKYIIALGILVLFLFIIFGLNTYYAKQSDLDNNISEVIPEGLLNVSDFIMEGFKELMYYVKDPKFSEAFMDSVVCYGGRGITIRFDDENGNKNDSKKASYFVSKNLTKCNPLELTKQIPVGYIGVFVDYLKIIEGYDLFLSEQRKLNICSTIEPSLINFQVIHSQTGFLNNENSLLFDEGSVSCYELELRKDQELNLMAFLGVILHNTTGNGSLKIQSYLVPEDATSRILKKQSFLEISNILEDFPVIWQIEKPIITNY